MARTIAAALTALAAGLALAVPAAGGGRGRPCVPAGAHVLAHGSEVRVYERLPRGPGEPPAIEACLAGHTGHMTLLAPDPRNHLHRSVGRFELAGHVLAYLATQFGVDSGTTRLVVADIGARRILRSIEAGSYADAGIIFRQAVTRFLVTPRGSIAWISERTRRQQLADVSVYAAPRQGPPALLDSGTDIDPRSLSLAGTTLRWSRAGSVRTAAMP